MCISSSMCTHQILIKDGAKAVRKPQRRLNTFILNVVKIETYIPLEDKKKTNFIGPFVNFTYRRMFFDPGIQSEGIDKNFKVN